MEWNIEHGAWMPTEKKLGEWHPIQCNCDDCSKMWDGEGQFDRALMKYPAKMYKDAEHSRFCTCFKCEDMKTDEQIRNMFP